MSKNKALFRNTIVGEHSIAPCVMIYREMGLLGPITKSFKLFLVLLS